MMPANRRLFLSSTSFDDEKESMCVAVICRGAFPDSSELDAMEKRNADGAGIAWLKDGQVTWKKGIDAEEIHAMITKKEVALPAFIHFRVASTGGIRPELCHPFPITKAASTDLTGSANAVLMHNGSWSYWGNKVLETVIEKDFPAVEGYWSDSRAMAYLADKHGLGILNMINGQRIAVMDKAGKMTFWGDWTKDYTRDMYYSNSLWKSEVKPIWNGCGIGGGRMGRNFVWRNGELIDCDKEDKQNESPQSTAAKLLMDAYLKARDDKKSDAEVEKLRDLWLKEEYRPGRNDKTVASIAMIAVPDDEITALYNMYGLVGA